MKWATIFLIGILCASAVFAAEGILQTYNVNEVFKLSVHLTNKTGEVTGANCTTQIRNNTYGIIDTLYMNEIGNGWYNATYNSSKTGTYLCRHNCTMGTQYKAETCDFIIKSDDTMAIALMIGMAIVIIALFVLSRYVMIEALKYLLVSIAMLLVISTLAIGLFLSQESLPAPVQEIMKNNYVVVLYTLDFLMAIGFIFIMFYYVSKWLPEKFKFGRKK